jgi:hypothetical protein
MLKYKLLTSLIGVILMTVPLIVNVSASTGMGGDPPGKGKDNPQPDRVGNEDEKDRDGPDGESAEGDDEGEANCWGKVTSDGTRTLEPGEFGQHAANPTGDDDNDTPREGVGNQDEDHPSDHADSVGGAFSDEECAED